MTFCLNGDDVCQYIKPSPIPDPYWVGFSPAVAKLLGIELSTSGLPSDPMWLNVLAGNALETTSHQFSNPRATVYSGHQFGVWAGQLGDGRAILLGEMNGLELQLKGAGKTRYSRMGDGRAVLRSSIREFLCSEAMHALGIPTTRALSVVGSELTVRRESSETAAVCARVAPSFIRIGHFEHFASLQHIERLKELADLLIDHHYPECKASDDPYLDVFLKISQRNAELVAQWQAVGFCHGVLNSDNISAHGLTMDYGPFGFLDQFAINHICNHSDQGGRYAYHRQPQIMHWNMACLANAFIPLMELRHPESKAQSLLREALAEFPITYAQKWQSLFRQKLGLVQSRDSDIALIERLLQVMHDAKVDFTTFFRSLSKIHQTKVVTEIHPPSPLNNYPGMNQWLTDYIRRLSEESSDDRTRKIAMDRINPKYILRNHLAQTAIEKAQQQDFSEIATLLTVLSNPFDDQPQFNQYSLPPPDSLERVEVSCSS